MVPGGHLLQWGFLGRTLSTRAVISGDGSLPRRQICVLVFSILVFRRFSVVFVSLFIKFSDIIGLLMA